jgi:hypothetical protein
MMMPISIPSALAIRIVPRPTIRANYNLDHPCHIVRSSHGQVYGPNIDSLDTLWPRGIRRDWEQWEAGSELVFDLQSPEIFCMLARPDHLSAKAFDMLIPDESEALAWSSGPCQVSVVWCIRQVSRHRGYRKFMVHVEKRTSCGRRTWRTHLSEGSNGGGLGSAESGS